tara:strand:- start:422 stop:994 length:573 start_codon:yes stop_codon:yes gene_type:complete
MKLIKTIFNEVLVLQTKRHNDERGFFSESFVSKSFAKCVRKKIIFCQDNLTYSKKNVIRGLHYQLSPHSQSKLVSVLEGKVLDVVVDIRKGSPTFGHNFSLELSSENLLQLFIPRGFAHGYITLSENSIFYYKVDQYHYPKNERSINPNDPNLRIDWKIPKDNWIQSKKDKKNPLLTEAKVFNFKEDLYG